MKTRLFFALMIFLVLLGCKTTGKAVGVNAETPPLEQADPEQFIAQTAAEELQLDEQESAAQETPEAQEIQAARGDAEISEILPEQEIDPIALLDPAREFSSAEERAEPLPFEGGEETAAVIPPQAAETAPVQQALEQPQSQAETPPANAAPAPAPSAARPQNPPAAPPPEQAAESTPETAAQAQEPQSEEAAAAEGESRPSIGIIMTADDVVPSRAVTVHQNQLLTVTYPGAGWVYLGEIDATGLFLYQERAPVAHNPRTEATTFTLKAQKQGTSYLHFYREDFLTNTGIDDYLEATVIPPRAGQEIAVNAPEYQIGFARTLAAQNAAGGTASEENSQDAPPVQGSTQGSPPVQGSARDNSAQSVPSAQGGQSQMPPAATAVEAEDRGARSTTVIQQTAAQEKQDTQIAGAIAAPPPVHAPAPVHLEEETAELYELALKAHNAGDQPQALDYINRFLADTNANIDKGLFLKGEILEAPSPVQNIKNSYAAYNRLVREFPTSVLWQQAKNRIIYLDKFYFSIR